jgi:transcriptional regulator with XRE-family HTH domain
MTPMELKLWRTARGLTQAQCAELAEVTRETVLRWEKGEHAIPDTLLSRLEAKSPALKAMTDMAKPADQVEKRWRPFPWGNRDYHIDKEVSRLPTGTKAWRVFLGQVDPQWELMIAHKQGHFYCDSRIKLPLEAFPDPAGIEAPWARQMFAERMAKHEAEIAGLRQAWKEAGLPDDDI